MARSCTTFRPGPDPRRHHFTKAERQRGYWNAVFGAGDVQVAAWVFRKVRGHYRRERRINTERVVRL